jgi:hypothetical protein
MNKHILEEYLLSNFSRRTFLKGTALTGMSLMLSGIECLADDSDGDFQYSMELTLEEIDILNGKEGLTLQKVMKTIVKYGDTFGATRMAPLDGPIHVVNASGLFILTPVFDLCDELIRAGLQTKEKFTVDPRPVDYEHIKYKPAQKVVFNILFNKQRRYENQLMRLGLKDKNAFTCTCYLDEVGNTPGRGDIIAWAESSAVVYANSVLGARCNRNSAILELLSGVLGKTPYFGLLTDEGRKATWLIEVETTALPEAQVLGSAIGMKVMDDVPYIRGLESFLGKTQTPGVKDYFKDMGAAAASNGAVGLFHAESITPEAITYGTSLLTENYQTYVIDDAVIAATIAAYPILWEDPEADPQVCFIGCPHLSLNQLYMWTDTISAALDSAGKKSVAIQTILTAAPDVISVFSEDANAYATLTATGVSLSSICPLLYMHNPLCEKQAVITNSNKLRTYTPARYLTDSAILSTIVTGRINHG